jgi:hypothetical protein
LSRLKKAYCPSDERKGGSNNRVREARPNAAVGDNDYRTGQATLARKALRHLWHTRRKSLM